MNLRERFLVSTATLLEQLPRVRDGEVDAIAGARVTTRRMRTMLPILSICYPDNHLKGISRTLKQIGRELGRVRELDVALEIVGELERTSPGAAACAANIRRSIVAERGWARCRLLMELEELAPGEIEDVAGRIPGPRGQSSMVGTRDNDRPLRDALRGQATALRQAMQRGSVLCAPKRAHRVRRAATKLRYILECTSHPEAVAPDGLKVLKKVQDVLGQLHDRQVLRERFARRWDDEGGPDVTAALATIDADCRRLFAAYVSRRAPLRQLCASIERSATSTSPRFPDPRVVAEFAGVISRG